MFGGFRMSRLADISFTTDLHLRLLLSIDRGHNVQRAVRAATRAGDRVLDAGTGTGLLSFVALTAGAEQAVAVDRQHLEVARAIAEKNGLADRIQFVEADLMRLDVPGADLTRRFDLLLAFIYNNHPMIDEARSRMVFELRDRYCVPGARIVPSAIRYTVTGCERTDWDLHTELTDLDDAATTLQACYGLDFQPIVDVTKQAIAVKRSRPIDPASTDWRPTASMASVRFDRDDVRRLTRTTDVYHVDYGAPAFEPMPDVATVRADAPGRMTGVIWTQELLYDGLPMWTSERFSPFAEPLPVTRGDLVELRINDGWRASNVLDAAVRRAG
jgi:SAM-dependent methyltransferase